MCKVGKVQQLVKELALDARPPARVFLASCLSKQKIHTSMFGDNSHVVLLRSVWIAPSAKLLQGMQISKVDDGVHDHVVHDDAGTIPQNML